MSPNLQPTPTKKHPKRTAFPIVLASLGVLWIIQIVNNADSYRLSMDAAIQPHIAADLPYILTAPFLHWSWAHIEGNSLPFLILGFLAAYRSLPRFIGVTAVVTLTSGMAIWLTAPAGSETVGASGVIFGWFGFVIVRGFFGHDKRDIAVGVIVMIYYFPIFSLLFPAPHLSYQGHIGGLIGGVLGGWIFQSRPTPVAGRSATASTSGGEMTGRPEAIQAAVASKRIEADLAALKQQVLTDQRSKDRSEG
jgi:membrane associated rhomboid family serine protease